MAVERLNDEQVIKLFKEDCNTQGLAKGTIESYHSILKMFSTYLKKKEYTLLTIDREILKEYISYLRKNEKDPKTIKNRFSALSSFYDYTVYAKFLENNLVKDIRKRYLKQYKEKNNNNSQRKLITVPEMAQFIEIILDVRDKAIAVLFAKTGIRRSELVAIDLGDINWNNFSIVLKPTRKRSNLIVFFDHECALVLRKWLQKREHHANPENKALFVSYIDRKKRLDDNGVWSVFVKWTTIAGLHNSHSQRIEDHFSPHCCRHWFTTFLRRAGMPREYIKWLRGDAITDSMDIYYHLDPADVRKSYLACIPKLGIT